MASTKKQRQLAALIVLSTIAIGAVLISQGSTRLLAGALLAIDPTAGPAAPTPPRPGQTTSRSRPDPLTILRRNIFDSQTGRLDIVPEPEPDPNEEIEAPVEEVDPNAPPPRCDGSMRLVGAFVRTHRPEDSFAAITDATGQSLLYQEGMAVDGRSVVAILVNRVILRPASGSLCSLSMFEEQGAVATLARGPAVAPAVAPAEPAGLESPEGFSAAELESGISQVSEREFSIERGLVERLLANQAALMRSARVIPHEENGSVQGVKVYGIRRASLLGRLGIQNGDMLRTINGYDMSSPDSALEAYARLRNADRITVNLVRRGQPMTVDYSIR